MTIYLCLSQSALYLSRLSISGFPDNLYKLIAFTRESLVLKMKCTEFVYFVYKNNKKIRFEVYMGITSFQHTVKYRK